MESKEIIWGLVALVGYAIAIVQTITNKRLQRKLVEAEFQKVVPIRENIKKLEQENKIRIHHLKDKKAELDKLEKEIKKTDDKEMTLEDALKILEL
jgi:UDP-N-acetylmuramyl pentapeptide synthase